MRVSFIARGFIGSFASVHSVAHNLIVSFNVGSTRLPSRDFPATKIGPNPSVCRSSLSFLRKTEYADEKVGATERVVIAYFVACRNIRLTTCFPSLLLPDRCTKYETTVTRYLSRRPIASMCSTTISNTPDAIYKGTFPLNWKNRKKSKRESTHHRSFD